MFLKNPALKIFGQFATSPRAWREVARRLCRPLSRKLSLGVCGILLDASGQVLLVRHTYRAGWYLPGGGVEARETLTEALTRELAEEAHIAVDAPPKLHGMFLQEKRWASDHVACFIVPAFHQTAPRPPDWEIAEVGFFNINALPADTSRAARARFREVLENLPPSPIW
jgi:ADP-ribose pyrophosphatase YjhB (NUDIX family)